MGDINIILIQEFHKWSKALITYLRQSLRIVAMRLTFRKKIVFYMLQIYLYNRAWLVLWELCHKMLMPCWNLYVPSNLFPHSWRQSRKDRLATSVVREGDTIVDSYIAYLHLFFCLSMFPHLCVFVVWFRWYVILLQFFLSHVWLSLHLWFCFAVGKLCCILCM